MEKKTCVITGATAGIGYYTALRLAEKNYNIFLLCRNEEKGEKTIDSILKKVPNTSIELVLTDLSSQERVREAAHKIKANCSSLDVLINNAGMWASKREFTPEGIEQVFAVNHLAPFLLTHLLYDNLIQAEKSSVINVNSDSHFNSPLFLNDLYLNKNYNGLRSYAQSKLANVLFTYEFDRRKPHQNVSINALQPGLVNTDIGLKDTTWLHALVWKIRRSGGMSPYDGSTTSVYLATSEEAIGKSGKYWDKCMPKPSSKHSYNKENARLLWEKSKALCGIDNYFGNNLSGVNSQD